MKTIALLIVLAMAIALGGCASTTGSSKPINRVTEAEEEKKDQPKMKAIEKDNVWEMPTLLN